MNDTASKWRSVTASAPAKVILHGEHSVVYGKLALAASIDLRTKVLIKLAARKRLLRVNLLNYSKKSLDFDLETLRNLKYDLKTTEIDDILKESLLQIVCDSCPEAQYLEHSEGLVALLYLCVAFFKESDLELLPLDITVTSGNFLHLNGLWRTLEDSRGLWRTLEDSAGLWRTLEDSAGLCRTLQDSAGLCRTLQDLSLIHI